MLLHRFVRNYFLQDFIKNFKDMIETFDCCEVLLQLMLQHELQGRFINDITSFIGKLFHLYLKIIEGKVRTNNCFYHYYFFFLNNRALILRFTIKNYLIYVCEVF